MNTIKNNTILGANFANDDVRLLIGAVLAITVVVAAVQLVRTIKRRAKKAAGTYAVVGALGTGGATNFQNVPEKMMQFISA